MTLYELTEEMQDLENGFNEHCIDPETGEINEEKVKEFLNTCKLNINDKLEGIVCIIKNQQALSNAIDNEIKTLKARKEKLDKKTDSLKSYTTACMQMLNMAKFESQKGTLSFRKSTKLEILNEDLITKDFKIEEIKYKVDKKAIKEAMQNGEIIEGVVLVESQNLQIK